MTNSAQSPNAHRAYLRYSDDLEQPLPDEEKLIGDVDDVLSFNSWRGLAAHRPLGSINRLKKRTYDASSHYRHEMNNAPRIEPADITELPK